jgi:protein-L-isoaspartate(D-aspartate) O-methyltransferase
MVILSSLGCKGSSALPKGKTFADLRKEMVKNQIEARGVKDKRVLKAMLKVERHLFVPKAQVSNAYDDTPLPIGYGQTISQPYIVAYMTEVLKLKGNEKVLEIGTGSGYQAAILSLLCKEVYTIEIIKELGETARKRLKQLGYKNVYVKIGDGYKGWPEKAPFDAIMLTAAPDHIPAPLKQQLKNHGRLLLPLGEYFQDLVLVQREGNKFKETRLLPVRFVPMTGKAQKKENKK